MRVGRVLSGLIAGAALLVVAAGPASATSWDVLAKGTQYCADSYSGHPSWFGAANSSWVTDINFPGDDGKPLFAPENGTVTVASTSGGYGNSIIWTNLGGTEKLHMAHLSGFGKTGVVAAGEVIGTIGNTGTSTGAHLHMSRHVNGAPAPMILSGQTLNPAFPADAQYGAWPCRTATYTSAGQATPSGPLADGTFVQRQGRPEIYVMAGEAPVYVSTWDAFGGPRPVVTLSPAQFDALRPQPLDNTYIFGTRSGRVFSVAGGAPVYLSNWAHVGGQAGKRIVGVDDWSIDNAGHPASHLLARPKDGAFIVARPSGRVFRIAGGAPIYVSTWSNVGGQQPVAEVDDFSVDRAGADFSHLNDVPADGTYLVAKPSPNVYIVAGGAPIYLSSWENVGGSAGKPIVDVDRWAVDNAGHSWSHLRPRPQDGVFLVGSPSGAVFTAAGGAPIYVSNWNNVGGQAGKRLVRVDDWSIANAGHPASHLDSTPADGTFLNASPSGRVFRMAGGAPLQITTWTVFGGAKPTVTIDDHAVNNAGGSGVLKHLLRLPRDGTLVRGLPDGTRWLVHSGSRTRSSATQGGIDVDQAGLGVIPLAGAGGTVERGGSGAGSGSGEAGGTGGTNAGGTNTGGGAVVVVSPQRPAVAGQLTLTRLSVRSRTVSVSVRVGRPGLLAVHLVRRGARTVIPVIRLRVRAARRVNATRKVPPRLGAGRFTLVVAFTPSTGNTTRAKRQVVIR